MSISEFFAGMLPIVGTVWITYQMITHIVKSRKRGNEEGRAELRKEQDDKDGV